MASWEELYEWNVASVAQLRGKKPGFADQRFYRSAVSRAYYAAYAAVTRRLVEAGTTFSKGWNNPEHSELPRLIQQQLAGRYSSSQLKEMAAAIRRLRSARIDADYRPQRLVDRDLALQASRDAGAVIGTLKKETRR